jgi:hypothetical protein
VPETVRDKKADKVRKPAGAPSSQRGVDVLTCREDQVEAILSAGESTKPRGKTGKSPHQKRQPKVPL